MATITVSAVKKNHRTVGYVAGDRYDTWTGVHYSCSCGKSNCEHGQAVSAHIKAEREERQARDREIAAAAEQSRKLAQAEQERVRRESAPLGGSREFSLLRK